MIPTDFHTKSRNWNPGNFVVSPYVEHQLTIYFDRVARELPLKTGLASLILVKVQQNVFRRLGA